VPVYYPSAIVEIAASLHSPASKAELDRAIREGVKGAKPASKATGKPMAQVLDPKPDDDYSVRFLVQPQKVSWSDNSPREANTASMTLRFADLPLEPRSIRSLSASIFAGPVAAGDYAEGVSSKQDDPKGRRSYVSRERKNLRFMGTVDKMDLSAGTEGDSLRIEFRDFTSLLIDRPVDTATLKGIKWSQPLPDVISQLVRSNAATASMPISYDSNLEEIPLSESVFRHVLGGKKGGEGKGVKRGSVANLRTTYWDLITDLCVYGGAIPMIDLDTLRIVKPRTLYTSRALSAAAFVWGGNLSEMQISRSFSKKALQGIEVTSFDPAAKPRPRTYSYRYPLKLRPKPNVSSEGEATSYRVYALDGLRESQLPKIAEALYFEQAMQGCEVTFSTNEMSVMGLDGSSIDLMGIQSGDPVNLVVATSTSSANLRPLFSPATLAEVHGMSQSQLVTLLQRRGVGKAVAPAVAKILTGARKLSAFRVQDVSHQFSESGYSASFTCMSFLELDPRLIGEDAGGAVEVGS
jgi:hypothetical protein